MFGLAPLALLFPAVGLLLNLAFGRRWREPLPGVVASLAAGASFLVSLLLMISYVRQPGAALIPLVQWIHVADLQVNWVLSVDALSLVMMAVVTGVGTLIHIYAIGYMHGDARYARFFVYLNLFLVMMLTLVTADSYAVLFVGWEGVGLCSFLLIGFWFDKPNGEGWRNSSAARKAFIVNRIGDAGFILAMALLFSTFGSLDFDAVFAAAPQTLTAGAPLAVAITLCLALAAAGKSAQIPLFVWLPDAMAGPTPVSALIHAATMVTAGVYLVARSHVLFDLAPLTQAVVTWAGALTALFGASVALSQTDIKRVLAYSTISQLGFMMAAVGLGAYVAAVFHLAMHAFFKALLFLAAGSVIHGMEQGGPAHGQDLQDMRLMGGLRARMPLTFGVYLVGALALAGLPPLSGFVSKDEILTAAFEHDGAIFLALITSALLTAFYMGRQLSLIWAGRPRSPMAAQAHESPRVMTTPLLMLALLAAAGGVINWPGSHALSSWLTEVFGEHGADFQLGIAVLSTLVAFAGLELAFRTYCRRDADQPCSDPLAAHGVRLLRGSQAAWGVDAFYQRVVVAGFNRVGDWLADADLNVLGAIENRMVRWTQRLAYAVSRTQTGDLRWNMVGIAGALIVMLAVMMWMRGG